MVKKISEVPEGIKILSFLFFAGALFSLIIGIVALSSSDVFRNADPALLTEANLGNVSPWGMVSVGVVLICLSFFQYLLGRDLLVAKNWTKITVGLLSVLGLVSAVMNFVNTDYASGVIGLAINGLIIWYLFVRKETKKFF